VCALAIALPLALGSPQRTAAAADPDLKELSTYTLSMDTLNKVERAMRAMMIEMQKDPKFQEMERAKAELATLKAKEETTDADDKRIEALEARIETLENDGPLNMNNAQTISEMAAAIQKEPRMTAALQREGLTPREYAKFMLAMLQAGFAAGMQKAGLLKTTPEGTNPANIKWVLDHESELKALQDAWEPEKKKEGGRLR
jgi:predicted RNase H-like nuclease (RuvC/YqgF family)